MIVHVMWYTTTAVIPFMEVQKMPIGKQQQLEQTRQHSCTYVHTCTLLIHNIVAILLVYVLDEITLLTV